MQLPKSELASVLPLAVVVDLHAKTQIALCASAGVYTGRHKGNKPINEE